jgi:hypothetical protein
VATDDGARDGRTAPAFRLEAALGHANKADGVGISRQQRQNFDKAHLRCALSVSDMV